MGARPRFMRKDACDRARGDATERGDRRRSGYGRGNHGGACARAWKADKSVSLHKAACAALSVMSLVKWSHAFGHIKPSVALQGLAKLYSSNRPIRFSLVYPEATLRTRINVSGRLTSRSRAYTGVSRGSQRPDFARAGTLTCIWTMPPYRQSSHPRNQIEYPKRLWLDFAPRSRDRGNRAQLPAGGNGGEPGHSEYLRCWSGRRDDRFCLDPAAVTLRGAFRPGE